MPMQYRYEDTPELERLRASIKHVSSELNSLREASLDVWPLVQRKLRIRWTADSNAIEGSTLTYAETLFFLEEGLTVEGKPLKDFLDARNHSDAIDYLMEVIKDERPITTSLMKELNALLMSGVKTTPAIDHRGQISEKPSTPGEYKKLPNHVLQADGSIHPYVDPIHVAQEMEQLMGWINEQEGMRDPILTAAIAHYNFVRIHPFDDGNGRGARILMNLILMKSGYLPIVIRREDRREYIEALSRADKGKLDSFIMFVMSSMNRTFRSVLDDLQRGNP